MPYTPLRELRPQLFGNEYETDGDDDIDRDNDDSPFDIDNDEFNLDGLDIDDDVPNRGGSIFFVQKKLYGSEKLSKNPLLERLTNKN